MTIPKTSRLAASVMAGMAAILAQNASAAPLAFECNAPSDTTSSVANIAQMPPAISGTISPKRARPAQTLPTVGAQLISPDSASEVGFILSLPAPNSQVMDVTLIVRRGAQSDNRKVGQIGVNEPIPFSLYVDRGGTATVTIGAQSWESEFVAIAGGTEAVFCSSGQFGFTNLRFSD